MADLDQPVQLPVQKITDTNVHDLVEVKKIANNTVFVRRNRALLIYQLSNKDYTEVFREDDFFSLTTPNANYPWHVYEPSSLIVRSSKGVEVYQWNKPDLKLQYTVSKYHDHSGYGSSTNTFLLGQIFPSRYHIGIISRLNSDVQFRALDLSKAKTTVRLLKKPPSLDSEWKSSTSTIQLVEQLDSNKQLAIALRTESKLMLFRFNNQYNLEKLTTIDEFPSKDTDYDRIMFAKFGKTSYNELMHFSTEGLMIYRFNDTAKVFQKIFYSSAFSKLRGWDGRSIDTVAPLDFDGDDQDELVYSGPKGLSLLQVNASSTPYELNEVAVETAVNQIVRYSFLKLAQKHNSTNDLQLFLHTSNGLIHVNIQPSIEGVETKPIVPANPVISTEQKELIPIPEIIPNRYHAGWLHDQLDMGSMLHPINSYNGAVELMIPIIDIPAPFGIPIRKIIKYKNVEYNNELGLGWSFPLDYIVLDRQSSAFEQDHVYSLVKENQRIIMMLQPTKNNGPKSEEKHFTIDGYPDIGIVFNTKRSYWKLSMDNRIMTYIALHQFQTVKACPLWPLCGSASRQTQTFTSQWYLNQEDNTDTGLRILYFYDLVKNKTDVRLTSINFSDDSMIDLSYREDRLADITVATHQFIQHFTFHYSKDVKPLLQTIQQSDHKLFDFEYDQHQRLSKIIYPNGAEWKPEYAQVTLNPTSLKKTIEITGSEANVYYGPDYAVVVDANLIDGRLLLHIRDPLGGISSNKTDSTETVYTLNDIKRYLVHAIENLIVVIVIYDKCKDVAILQYTSDRWRQQKYYDEFPLDGTITTGSAFVLLSDKKSLRLITTTTDHQLSEVELRPNLPANFVVKAFAHGYATYDGRLEIFLLQQNGEWVTVKAAPEQVNYFNEIDKFVSSFEINSELRQSIRRGLTADMLGSYRQAIILKAPFLQKDVLNIHVRFFMLSLENKPHVFDCYTTVIPHTVLTQYNYTVNTDEKDSFVLGYRLVKEKYHLYVKKSTGPHAVELNKYMKAARQEMSKHRKGSAKWNKINTEAQKTTREESQRIYKAVKDAVVFALDLSQFGMLTNQEGVLTGNHQITYDGFHWNKRLLDEDTIRLRKVNQNLSADYRLVKVHDKDTFKIVSVATGETLFDTNTTKSEELQLTVPYYAQSQPQGSPLRLYFFASKQTVTFPDEERLNRASNQIAIVTTYQANATAQFLVFRCMKYFLNPNVTVLGGQTLAYIDETVRKTAYLYDPQDVQLSVDGIVFRKIKIATGADTSRFGWYEQTIDIATGNTVRKAIAADGREVLDRKLRDQEEKRRQSENQNTSAQSERMISDASGRHPIVDLGPYRLVDEMVSYYGFEPYERNHFGKEKKWTFDKTLIKSQNGNSFLTLSQPEHKLVGVFTPQEPLMNYVISCWVRTSKALKLGDTVDIVALDVLVEKGETKKISLRKAEVKQRIGSWSYVETIVDTTHFPTETKLVFDVSFITSTTHARFDIDHIRFSPLSMPFAANIYEPARGSVSALLSSSGLMKRYLYNCNGKRTTVFSEQGMVEEFITESKALYTRESGRRPCVIEMKPRKSAWAMESGWDNKIHSNGSVFKTFDETWATLAVRFLYSLQPNDNGMRFVWRGKECYLPCPVQSVTNCRQLPRRGEILIFITSLRVSVWLEGVLVQETLLEDVKSDAERKLTLHLSRTAEITEFFEMYDSTLKISYQQLSGQPVQVLEYESPDTVRVREILYDDIERPILQTKWTKVHPENDAKMFEFHENFIRNLDNATQLLTGKVAELNPSCEGYPYTHTIYGNDPTENKRLQGLPGKDYTVNAKYKRSYSYEPHNLLLSNLFPPREGFHHKAVQLPGGAVRVTIENAKGKKVARYSKVGSYENRLSTWRYGSNDKLQQELPPMYHYRAHTSTMENVPFFVANYTSEQMQLQQQWEVRFNYDNANRLIRKRTPDGGIWQYLYDKQGILRFSLHKEHNETLDRVIHFTYVSDDKVAREALVHLNETECIKLVDSGVAPNSTNFIDTIYGEYDDDPNLRYRSAFATRRIGGDQMTEYLVYDQSKRVLKKVYVINTLNTSYSIDYEYENDNLRSIKYPFGAGGEPFRLIYDWNGNSDVISIRESTMTEPMFEFSYNADGMVETMNVRTDPTHTFQRNFTYNEPGFLIKLADNYLTESVSYLETDSYGQGSYTPIYEGLISKTLFTAHWQKATSPLRNGIYTEYLMSDNINRAQASLCLEVLKRTGYIDENNLVNRTLYGDMNDDLPFVCGKRLALNHLSKVLSTRSFPYQYGHRYDYDDHDQLIKAKYFHGLEELKLAPLTHHTFLKEIKGIDEAKSKKIWDALREKSFLTTDCTNPSLCHGREGTKSIFSDFIHQHRYSYHLKLMLSKAISARKGLDIKTFEEKCTRWIEGSNMILKACTNLKEEMMKQKLFGESADAPVASLSEGFRKALQIYNSHVPDIVGVLNHHFMTALGRAAGDVQSYEIDANGNHRKFYTGFSRYRLEYQEGTNKIIKLYRQQFDRAEDDGEEFTMAHDGDGAVIQAEHKSIKHMAYDKLLQRVSEIEMTDGRKILYQYDVRAERTFKQVRSKDETVLSEKYYIRDANGFVLMDIDMVYLTNDHPPDVRVTSYIYKDQQLIGFVRNDKLYGVITDHEGSVRLVVREGEVVAAYDYLPYGQIFRRFGTDLDGQISYLYTGQEWEPETGLYNYRARLYDPDIGRFYQMDPKEQYPSPYVYAGNSPVSLIDPDGELAFAISCIIMAIIGAYIGASAAAQSWNPLEWNWKSKSLWLGMIGGALTGLSIPFNLTASIAYFVGMGLSLSASIGVMIGSGITFGYFALAASSGSWDPRNFDFSSPGTWNALLGGIATSAFIVTNPNQLINTFRSITTTLGRALFVTATVSITITFAYLFGALKMGGEFDMTKWDYSDPRLYHGILDAYVTASFTMIMVRNIPNTIKSLGRKIETGLDRLAETEVFFRAKQLMRGGDWSTKLSNARFFMAANAKAIGDLQRGIIPIAFYTFIVTLRMVDAYEKSSIPGFSVFLQILSTAVMTRGFTNRVVKPLIPKRIDAPLAQKLIAPETYENSSGWHSSSGANSLGSFLRYLCIPLNWFLNYHENTPEGEQVDDNTIQRYKSHYTQTSKHSMIENCYPVTHGELNYVNCYSDQGLVTIFPKVEAILQSHDEYRNCLPLTYDGVRGISCDGEQSTLLAVQLEPPRLFDYVDSWLLLAHVAPAAVREAKRIVQNFFGWSSGSSRTTKDLPEIRKHLQKRLENGLSDLEILQNKALANRRDMDWFGYMLEDLREDVQEYLKHGHGNGNILMERLMALHTDALEEIELHEANLALDNLFQRENLLGANPTVAESGIGQVQQNIAASCCAGSTIRCLST
ncbi:uncharacterized protein LOC121595716 [Anopheles merus]|uniref:uncharacterized protein LOC121595716 n=1 Tax=Anopheles merus TaxID=30066 RepID=UPI001BE42B1E|nr:uncharacterized protein LOC121595716 [Anopheles merus]